VRRLRAILVVALLWVLALAPVGILWGLYLAVTRPGPEYGPASAHTIGDTLNTLLFGLLNSSIPAFFAGAAFALILAIAERSKSVEQLTPGRLALWGVVGALGMPVAMMFSVCCDMVMTSATIAYLLITAVAGGLCAVGTVFIAQRRIAVSE
jgi:hypothetical protein